MPGSGFLANLWSATVDATRLTREDVVRKLLLIVPKRNVGISYFQHLSRRDRLNQAYKPFGLLIRAQQYALQK